MRFRHILFIPLFLFVFLFLRVLPVYGTSSTDTMVGYWKFDESSAGSTATDSSGSGNNLTPAGGSTNPGYSTTVPYTTFPDSHSSTYDGTQYETISSNSSLNVTNLTLSTWVKFNSVNSAYHTIAGKWRIGVNQQYVLQLNSDNTIGLFTGDGSTGGAAITTSGTFTPTTGVWYHIAATVSGTTGTIYINGISKASGTVSAIGTSSIEFTVGSKKNVGGTYAEFLDGSLDDMRLYNRALSTTEITALAAGNHTTATWSGGTSTNYETASNWNISAVPDPYTLLSINTANKSAVMSTNESIAGVTVGSNGLFNLSGFNLTMNDASSTSGLATSSGTLVSQNSETLSNFSWPVTAGTVMFNHTANKTGFTLGNSFYNLVLNDGLIGYWKLDETTQGSDAVDSSGYGMSATSTGSPKPDPTSAVPPVLFADNRSATFDGSSSYFSIPGTWGGTSMSQVTVSAWYKGAATSGGFQAIVEPTDSAFVHMQLFSGGNAVVYVDTGAINLPIVPQSTGSWHNIIITARSGATKEYLDGVQQGSTDTTTFSNIVGTSTLQIGRGNGGIRYFNGQIDDVRIYNRALSSSEVAALVAGDEPATSLATTTLNHELTVTGNLVLNAGTLDVSNSNYGITDSGNFENNGGIFTPRNGTVTLNASNGQTINSSNTFYNLTKSPIPSDHLALTFGAGSTQTVLNTLSLNGTNGGFLGLFSSSLGSQWKIDPQGTRDISYASVYDSNNINVTPIGFSATNIYQTNLTNWITTDPTPSTSPSNTSNPSSPACTDSVPIGVSNLFQIDAAGTYVNLYFTKAKADVNGYAVSYGLTADANNYGDSFSYTAPDWVIGRKIGLLEPNTTYYFKVKAINGCNGGSWSNTMSIKTKSRFTDISKFFSNLNPFKKSPTPVTPTGLVKGIATTTSCIYTIQSGDSLWSIANRKWGNGAKYSQLLPFNPALSPTSILKVGSTLKLCD
jgi:hypothetical protein